MTTSVSRLVAMHLQGQMRTIALRRWTACLALACAGVHAQAPASNPPEPVDPLRARALADARFLAVARALGSKATAAPTPELDRDGDAVVFLYVDPTSAKRITIFVPPDEQLSARVQGP